MKLNNNVEVSFRDGAIFRFIIDDNEILYKCSPFSGRETVELNNEMVSETKNFKLRSSHNFTINSNMYEISFESKNLLKGDSECTLKSEGKIIQAYRLQYIKPPKPSVIIRILPIILGLLVGIGISFKLIPFWLSIILFIVAFIAVFVISFMSNIHNWKCEVRNA